MKVVKTSFIYRYRSSISILRAETNSNRLRHPLCWIHWIKLTKLFFSYSRLDISMTWCNAYRISPRGTMYSRAIIWTRICLSAISRAPPGRLIETYLIVLPGKQWVCLVNQNLPKHWCLESRQLSTLLKYIIRGESHDPPSDVVVVLDSCTIHIFCKIGNFNNSNEDLTYPWNLTIW